MQRDPWDEGVGKLAVGTRVQGKVMRIENFGAFVEILPGVEGLVHISEMGEGERISSARKVVDVGQEVMVKIMSIDTDKRRVSLSMDAAGREARAADEREAMDTYGSDKGSFGTFADLLADADADADEKK
jgi:small subunit ribosomal protein S1